MSVHARLMLALLIFTLLAGCTGAEPTGETPVSPTATRDPGVLVPYHTATPTLTATPRPTATPTLPPTPTPTPVTHTVKAGDTLILIASQYGVTVDALIAANPDIVPDALRIGSVVIIPDEEDLEAIEAEVQSPEVLPLHLGEVSCATDLEGGVWCFLQVSNPYEYPVEGVSVTIRLTADSESIEQVATAPLDFLLPGGDLPLGVYFSPPLPGSFGVNVEMRSGIAVENMEGRFLPVLIENERTEIREDGLGAEVSGDIVLGAGSDESDPLTAREIWVVAAAYDEAGRIVGLRRLEIDLPLSPGGSLPFSLRVFSAGGMIRRVLTLAEAHP
jgi:LysM repeat protein